MNIKFPFVASKSGLHNGVPWVASLFLAPWRTAAASNGEQMADLLPWLFGIPGWLLFIALMGAFAGLALLALAAYRRWLAPRLKRAPGRPDKRANYYVAATGAVVGIVVGLLLADYWEAYVSRMIAGLPPTAAGRVQPPENRGEDLTPEMLADLIDKNPAEVSRLVVPDEARAVLPVDTQNLIEGRQEVEGKLQVLHLDYKDPGQSHYLYLLEGDSGEHISLHFAKPPPRLLSGARLRAKGLLFRGLKVRDAGEMDGAMLLDDESTGVQILEAGGSATTAATSTVLPNTVGEQKTVVLLVNFQDNPTNKPWTADNAHGVVFGTVSDFMRENSFQRTWLAGVSDVLAGDVYGWYTLGLDSTVCDTTQIAAKADSAATAGGADLSLYTRRIYIFPSNSTCGWSGAGTVGGTPSQTWINGKMELKIIGHELGHNFGLQHAHALECGTSTLGSACQKFEYGDHFDIMGNYTAGHYNAFHKAQLGWLGYGESPPITTVETTGTYSVAPYEIGTGGTKALKILKAVDPTTNAKSWYYVEYRQASGFDSFLMANISMLNGVVIHTGSDPDLNSSFHLDMTPASQATGYDDWEDSPLPVGQSFTDPDSGVTITTAGADSAGASVAVDFGTQSCVRANPGFSLSTSQSSGVSPGTPVSYAVSVTNRDNSACGTAQFALTASQPSGWSATFASPTLSAAAGATASTTLTVTSSSSAAAGSYVFPATVTDSANSAFKASTSVTYSVVVQTLSTAVATDKTAYKKGDTVTITASASSGGKPIANAGVKFVVTKPNGSTVNQSATTGSNGQAVYRLRLSKQKDPAGTYQVRVDVTSGTQTASAFTNFGVN